MCAVLTAGKPTRTLNIRKRVIDLFVGRASGMASLLTSKNEGMQAKICSTISTLLVRQFLNQRYFHERRAGTVVLQLPNATPTVGLRNFVGFVVAHGFHESQRLKEANRSSCGIGSVQKLCGHHKRQERGLGQCTQKSTRVGALDGCGHMDKGTREKGRPLEKMHTKFE